MTKDFFNFGGPWGYPVALRGLIDEKRQVRVEKKLLKSLKSKNQKSIYFGGPREPPLRGLFGKNVSW